MPKRKKKRYNIYLEIDLWERMTKEAKKREISTSEYIRDILSQNVGVNSPEEDLKLHGRMEMMENLFEEWKKKVAKWSSKPSTTPNIMTKKEAANYIAGSVFEINRFIKIGILKSYKAGKETFILKSDLESIIVSHKSKSTKKRSPRE